MSDETFLNNLAEFKEQLYFLESKYKISSFTPLQWKDLIRMAHQNGIYLFPKAKAKISEMSKKNY